MHKVFPLCRLCVLCVSVVNCLSLHTQLALETHSQKLILPAARSPEDRKADVEQVRVEAGVDFGAVAVRDVLVAVAERPRAAQACLPLDAAAEVAREVEARPALVGDARAEVEEAAARLHERLHALAPAEV